MINPFLKILVMIYFGKLEKGIWKGPFETLITNKFELFLITPIKPRSNIDHEFEIPLFSNS